MPSTSIFILNCCWALIMFQKVLTENVESSTSPFNNRPLSPIPTPKKNEKYLLHFNKFFHKPQQPPVKGQWLLWSPFSAQMGLFNSLPSTFTSHKAPKMKLPRNACHTVRFIMSAKIAEKRKRDLKSFLRLVVLFLSHLSKKLSVKRIHPIWDCYLETSPGFISMM